MHRKRALDDRRTHSGQGSLHGRRPRRHGTPELCRRSGPVPPRPLFDNVRDASVDHPSIRRLLDRRGVQCVLSPQPRCRSERSLRGLRPGDAPRLRRRSSARSGRCRQGRRVDLLGRGYEGAVQRHSARQNVGLDDHERRRAADSGLLHCYGVGAGLHARPAGRYDPKRYSEGVHGAQHLYLSARIFDAHHRRYLRVHLEEHAQVQLHLHFGLPHAGGRRHSRH